MEDRLKQPQRVREFSQLGVEFCASDIAWPGQPGKKLSPDQTKAYCTFDICFAWPVRTAYGTVFHPGTLHNSQDSMLHQVFNRGHRMKNYDREANHSDENFGSIVGVEYARAPMGGWKINAPGNPHYHAAAVIHKQVAFVPKLLGEYLGGRHKWAVSQETNFSMLESGFVIEPSGKASPGDQEVMNRYTPEEFKAAGLAYVPILVEPDSETLCPDELLGCYSFEERRIVKDWNGRVSLLKGGVNGRVHVGGVGMVRYGAEKEAQIQQLIAHDPDRIIEECSDDDLALAGAGFLEAMKIVSDNSKNLLTEMASAVLRRS